MDAMAIVQNLNCFKSGQNETEGTAGLDFDNTWYNTRQHTRLGNIESTVCREVWL